MIDYRKAYIYALAAVLLWSTVASAFKLTLAYLDPVHLLLYSSFISLLLLFIILLFQGKMKLIAESLSKDLLKSAIMGFLNPFLYYLILFKAYDLLPAQEALTLNYSWAIVVVLLSIPILKQKIKLGNMIALFISFFGVIIIATHGDIFSFEFSNIYGVSLAIGSSFVWALFWLFNVKDKRDETVKLFLNFLFGFVFILIYSLIFIDIKLPNLFALIGTAYIGCFEMGITFIAWLLALKHARTTAQVSNLIYLSPFLSLFFINIFVGETILISTIIGLGLIVTGILFQQILSKK